MKILVTILLSFFMLNTYTQEHLGMDKADIMKEMKKDTEFRFIKEVMGKKNYLKYEDYPVERTIIFRIDNNVCSYIIKMYDYSYKSEVIDELNNKLTLSEKNVWKGKHNRQTYRVRLQEEEWFFKLIYEPLN